MHKMILHIGPPKTGTTTLQELVFPKLSRVCFLGKPWWNPSVPYDKCVALHQAIDSVTKSAIGSFDEDRAKTAVDKWLQHAPNAQQQPDGSYLTRLLSEERLSYTERVPMQEIARRLAILFPGAEVVYVKRDLMSALRSYHRWLYARAWIDEGFSEWLDHAMKTDSDNLAQAVLRCYRWPEIDKAFGWHFPTIRCVDFNDMLSDTRGYLEKFFGFDDSEFADFAWLRNQPKNASPNRAVSEIHRMTKKSIRIWNRLPFRKIDENPEYLGDSRFWKLLECPLRHLKIGEQKLAATDDDRSRILAYYASTK